MGIESKGEAWSYCTIDEMAEAYTSVGFIVVELATGNIGSKDAA